MARRVKIDMLTVKQEVKELKLQVFNCSTFQISSFIVSSLLFVIFSGFQGHGSSFFLQFLKICNLYSRSIKNRFENVAGIYFLQKNNSLAVIFLLPIHRIIITINVAQNCCFEFFEDVFVKRVSLDLQ